MCCVPAPSSSGTTSILITRKYSSGSAVGGKWLKGTIGFDGFRLDFVRGLQPEFVSRWIEGLPLQDGQQPFIVGEYWAKDGRYIKEWVDNVAQGGADVHVFDFPLKFILTEMCDKSGDEFDMSRLAHAGMIRGFALPAKNVVTFVDNHDTGKEHDKWLVKDYAMAYAYILTHEGTPCLFYPHFYAVTQHDVDNPSLEVTAPLDLQLAIRKLIDIRRQYLGGTLAVLTESDKHLYVARRQGNGKKDGAIIVLNNHDWSTFSIFLLYIYTHFHTDFCTYYAHFHTDFRCKDTHFFIHHYFLRLKNEIIKSV